MMMRLADKVAYSGGENYLPALARPKLDKQPLTDGLMPYSVKQPLPVALGAAFSSELCAEVARAEARIAFGYGEAFAGTVPCGLIRDPMRASAAELFSEDAYLVSELLKGYTPVGGLGFVFTDAFGQERFVNRTIDQRALHELYLFPLIKSGNVAAGLQLDGGYLNGMRVCSSGEVYELLIEYVPENVPVFTQYGDLPEVEKLYDNGTYMLGLDGNYKRDIALNVKWGIILESKIDGGIERTLSLALDAHDRYQTPETDAFDDGAEFPDLARESTVLLKNNGVLPTGGRSLTLFGNAAAFDDGNSFDILSVNDADKQLGAVNVFLVTDYEYDGIDGGMARAIMGSLSTAKTVIVLCGGCAVELGAMAEADAILFCPHATYISDITAMLADGSKSPLGHLPFTWAKKAADYPCNNKKFAARGDFRYESLYNGHLYFDNFDGAAVQFPFGHGLNYTSYSVGKLKLASRGQKITVATIVKNTGTEVGTLLLQAYVTLVDAPVYGISKRLAAFKKIKLDPTENAEVTLEIDINDFAVYDEAFNTYPAAGGKYKVEVGLSGTDIRASGEIKVAAASRVTVGLNAKSAPAYYAAGKGVKFAPTAPEIEKLLKVPFIKRPDEYPELAPPTPADVKKALKRVKKYASGSKLQILKYRIAHYPARNGMFGK